MCRQLYNTNVNGDCSTRKLVKLYTFSSPSVYKYEQWPMEACVTHSGRIREALRCRYGVGLNARVIERDSRNNETAKHLVAHGRIADVPRPYLHSYKRAHDGNTLGEHAWRTRSNMLRTTAYETSAGTHYTSLCVGRRKMMHVMDLARMKIITLRGRSR